MSTLSVRLPDSLHKRIKQIAEGEGVFNESVYHLGSDGEGVGADDG